MAALLAACSSHNKATPPADPTSSADATVSISPEATQLHLACLLPTNVLEQIKACTVAISSGALPQKELSNALAVRGSAYLRMQRLIDARIDLEEAKRLDPGNPVIDRGLALIETAESRTDAAQATEIQTLTDCAESPEPSLRLAACDRVVAEAAGDPAREAKAYDMRAFVRIQERNAAGALEDLDKAIALAPESSDLRGHRFRALFMAERYGEALQGLESLLEQEPFNDSLKSMVGTIYYVQNDQHRALSEFQDMRYWQRQEDLPAARAATIQAEIGTGESLFNQLAASVSVPRWLSILGSYRTSLISEQEFRSDMAAFAPVRSEDINCFVEFQAGHQRALKKDTVAARAALSRASALCGLGEFEYHAARKWLLKLGA